MSTETTETEKTARTHSWQQLLYVLAPFFLLLVCLGFINFIPGRLTAVPTASPQSKNAAAGEPTTVSPTPDSASDALPAATIPPTSTIIPTATLPPDAAIALLGPPVGSSFQRNDTISFYVDWPFPLTESQQLAAYVRFNDQPATLLGVLDEPNTGQRYRWQMNVREMTDTAVSFEWWVQLQTSSDAAPLLTSPSRTVTLLP